MPLVYLPRQTRLFAWGEDVRHALAGGEPARAAVITPDGLREVEGAAIPLSEGATRLALVPSSALPMLPASFAAWSLASKLALELVARERVVPTLARRGERIEARWAAALSASEDASRVAAIAAAMPPSAHAIAVSNQENSAAFTAATLLRDYLDACVDALVRDVRGAPTVPRPLDRSPSAKRGPRAFDERFAAALTGEPSFEAHGFTERSLVDDVARWSEPAVGARDRLRACFRLELPSEEATSFTLRFLLNAPDDPSLLVDAADVWNSKSAKLDALGRAFRDPQDALLEALGRAARLFTPIERALAHAKPTAIELDPAEAWTFLAEAAIALGEAGFGVIVPAELTAAGQRRLRMRMRVGGKGAKPTKVAGVVEGVSGLALDELLTVDWQVMLGDREVSARELAALAAQKAPLVRHRGAWIAIDPAELTEIRKRIAAGPSKVTTRAAMQMALAGEARVGALAVAVEASGTLATGIERMRHAASSELPVPRGLLATLRPYQRRGLSWLATMSGLGLGACLADDMGLGKTVQLIAYLLRRAELDQDELPSLLVAPTSVVGNWERELARFGPSLEHVAHYGSARKKTSAALDRPGALVVTTYGLLRRDAALLASIEWGVVVLDEAQNIKNGASATARAARSLVAAHRFALTGTPVENRLAELWSILEFANPGLLGTVEAFRREHAVPIERYGDEEAARRLKRIVGPFVLRRLKSDPAIIDDLPPKLETRVVCTLTREQATLYRAAVDEEMARIERTDGIERRGRVLALLTALKQICNHPAQYLGEAGPLPRRSGKLARVTEMLEEAVAAGDRALVFTQYREMGERLVAHLRETLGVEIAFLHGATSKRARDAMVARFQDDPRGPPVFVLSLKAGGTGLNLTAASHVFHFDRWWNPAVEEQATDRAYRIGQRRTVQVHKLVCAGTVEEKIDHMLEQKRALAAKVVGSGEKWITELGDTELRELFALDRGAVVAEEEAEPAPRARRAEARA